MVFDLIIFIIGIYSISAFYLNNTLLTFILIISWIVSLKLWHEKHDTCFFISAAIVGPIGEIFAIYFGAWNYVNPTFLGIPIWLPLAWGFFVVLIKRFAELFVKIEIKNNGRKKKNKQRRR